MTAELALFEVFDNCMGCGRTLAGSACPWCAGRASGAEASQVALAAANRSRDLEWAERADLWLRTLAGWEIVQPITADDLIEAVGLPAGSENQIGARFQAWRKAGYIRQAGVETSKRPSNHGRLLRAWEVIA